MTDSLESDSDIKNERSHVFIIYIIYIISFNFKILDFCFLWGFLTGSAHLTPGKQY